MEIVIVICLLIVIVLLAKDKVVINSVSHKRQEVVPVKSKHPNIMGEPKPVERLAVPTKATESQTKKTADDTDNFETETTGEFSRVIPQEELEEVFEEMPDLEAEEEEWQRDGVPNGEDGFATGVTYEELSTVGLLLQQEVLEPSFQEQAVALVRKIQGTELFSLLENSIEHASQRIASLLDTGMKQQVESSSSATRNVSLDGFDIGEFV